MRGAFRTGLPAPCDGLSIGDDAHVCLGILFPEVDGIVARALKSCRRRCVQYHSQYMGLRVLVHESDR